MKYQALPPGAQAFVDMRWAATCQTLDAIVPGLSPFEKTALINAYQATVDVLAAPFQGWLTSRQAATLKTLAAAL
jgi:hypothetical protein